MDAVEATGYGSYRLRATTEREEEEDGSQRGARGVDGEDGDL